MIQAVDGYLGDSLDMNTLDDLLSLNNCDMDDFLELTHKTMMLFILEEICRKLKDEDERKKVVKEYQKNTFNERATRKIVRRYCGIDLPEKDLMIMTEWILDYLTKMDSRNKVPKEKKIALLEQQSYICACCGAPIDLNNSHYDHDIPWTYVGDELEDNYQMLCEYCNEHKSSRPYYMLKRKIVKKNN